MSARRSSQRVRYPRTSLSEERIPDGRFTNSDSFYFFKSANMSSPSTARTNPVNHQNKSKNSHFSTNIFLSHVINGSRIACVSSAAPLFLCQAARLVSAAAASAQRRVKGRLRDDGSNHMARSSQASRRRETIGNCADGDLQERGGKSYVHIRLF